MLVLAGKTLPDEHLTGKVLLHSSKLLPGQQENAIRQDLCLRRSPGRMERWVRLRQVTTFRPPSR